MRQTILILLGIFLIALSYRFRTQNFPFWVDEFSSAAQATLLQKSGLRTIFDQKTYFETRSLTTYSLVASSFTLFGRSEATARYPFMIIGASVVVLIFILTKKISDTTTAICAALLSTTSYYMITWSSQARSYPVLQALTLLFFIVYLRFFEKVISKKNALVELFTLGILAVIGVVTHVFFFCAIFACLLHILFSAKEKFFQFVKTNGLIFGVGSLCFLAVVFFSGILGQSLHYFESGIKSPFVNNLWYYHSFLWRVHPIETLLGMIGLLLLLKKSRPYGGLLIILSVLQILLLSFGFRAYVSRYLVTVFPMLFIGMAYCIVYFLKLFWQQELQNFLPRLLIPPVAIALCMIIILQGDKYTLKPKPYYSVNHEFREVAVLDYSKMYDLIKQKGELEKGQTAVIDTWPDRLSWYLGESYPGFYVFRWSNAGFMKETPYTLNSLQEKLVKQRSNVVLISELADLTIAMKKFPRGFIWIDDTTLPADVIEYAQKHLQLELKMDHYFLDDNPNSLWPGSLYSWGINK